LVSRLKRSSLSECRVSARTYFPSEMVSMSERQRLLLRFFQDSLFQLFLAFYAVPSPGNRFQPLGIDFLAAGNAFPEAALADALQSAFHHLQELAFIVALAKEEFLGIGAGGAVGNILRGIFIGAAPILLGAADIAAQLLLPRLQ